MKATYITPELSIHEVRVENILQDLSKANVYNPITGEYESGGPSVEGGGGTGDDQAKDFIDTGSIWDD